MFKAMNQKGFSILIIPVLLVIVVIFTYFFLAQPYKVSGDPIPPLKNGEMIWGEKISYMFAKPQKGDMVIYLPQDNATGHIGVIADIVENNGVTAYKIIYGSNLQSRELSQDKIITRIYYPALSKEEILKILSTNLPIPSADPKACTQEAKICPDGSAVGRTGPNCEFAPCPGEKKTDTQEYRVGGSFTEKATEAEISSLGSKLGSDASSVSLLESFPLQFQITSPSSSSCEKVKKVLSAFKFIDSFGDCQKVESGTSDNSNQSIISQ